jgi:hypothetical protein
MSICCMLSAMRGPYSLARMTYTRAVMRSVACPTGVWGVFHAVASVLRGCNDGVPKGVQAGSSMPSSSATCTVSRSSQGQKER